MGGSDYTYKENLEMWEMKDPVQMQTPLSTGIL